MRIELHAEPIDPANLAGAVANIRQVLPLLLSPDPVKVVATASAILQTVAEIRLGATLKGLQEFEM